ncbi:MAG: hypothetical protein ABFD54_17250 [Armatimonadota bacterium]
MRNILVKEGIPYGFTLTIWATGTLGIEKYGHPSEGEVFLFVGAAILSYAVFAVLLTRYAGPLPHQTEEEYSGISFVDFLSVPAAVGVAIGVYHLVRAPLLGFPLASFLAVLVYNLVLAAKRWLFGSGSGV